MVLGAVCPRAPAGLSPEDIFARKKRVYLLLFNRDDNHPAGQAGMPMTADEEVATLPVAPGDFVLGGASLKMRYSVALGAFFCCLHLSRIYVVVPGM